MRRRLFVSIGVFVVVLGALLTTSFVRSSRANSAKESPQEPTKIRVVAYGPTQADIDSATIAVAGHSDVQKYLAGTNNRLLSFQLIDPDNKGQTSLPPSRFHAEFYDYTHNRLITVEGEFKNLNKFQVSESYFQPLPSEEEFEFAERTLKNDKQFGASLRNGSLKSYRPMPPVISDKNSNGHGDRIITVGLMGGTTDELQNEIVGVNLSRGGIVRFEAKAPPSSLASPDACGVPPAGQSTTPRNTAGEYQLTVTQGTTELWSLLVIRPSVSSGTRASGIELRNVTYRGKSVLKRGHVPVLNVQYPGGQCGPYRDWQYQEGQFQTPAGSTDPAPGIRMCPSPATTELETGNDTGNFRGVAIYSQNNETVLVTELEAGWYRYIMEWRLGNDGTIRPRFGFGATDNSCVCFLHNHHVYWRFDFDTVNTNNNVFVIQQGKKWLSPLLVEAKISRNQGGSIFVQNGNGLDGYLLRPSASDGGVDAFGVGDMWVLQYKGTGATPFELQLDDGFNQTTSPNAFIQIDPFVNGESVAYQDVVVWYGAHFVHSDGANLLDPNRDATNIIGTSHVVGPDLIPMNW